MKMDAVEAARVIRPHFDELSSQLSPEDRHRAKFVENICAELGVPPNLENGTRVMRALTLLGAEPHVHQQYPAWVDHPTEKNKDGSPVRVHVHDENEEKQVMAGETKPEDKTPEQKLAEERVRLEAENAKLEAAKDEANKAIDAGKGDEQPVKAKSPPAAPVRRTP